DAISKRAGGAIHNAIVGELYTKMIDAGYWVEVDTGGDIREEKPDLLVFMPEEQTVTDKKANFIRSIRSTEEWGVPVAYEVETLSNPAEQVRKNLYKNLKMGYRVVFVVENEGGRRRIREILGEGNYEVILAPMQINQ
ncbi:MAG: hypothetical protein ACP5NC_08585, partial [Nitrososphaeria archaeon]